MQEATEVLRLPRAQLTSVHRDIPEDVECALGFETSTPSSRYFGESKIRLRFSRKGHQDLVIVLDGQPPLGPLTDFPANARDLYAAVRGDGSVLDRAANRVYTPLARLEVRFPKPCGHGDEAWFTLKIGEWTAIERSVSLYYLCTD